MSPARAMYSKSSQEQKSAIVKNRGSALLTAKVVTRFQLREQVYFLLLKLTEDEVS